MHVLKVDTKFEASIPVVEYIILSIEVVEKGY